MATSTTCSPQAPPRRKRAGFARILSDVDTDNHPMLAAMERAGHRASSTPWHVWSHRGEVN